MIKKKFVHKVIMNQNLRLDDCRGFPHSVRKCQYRYNVLPPNVSNPSSSPNLCNFIEDSSFVPSTHLLLSFMTTTLHVQPRYNNSSIHSLISSPTPSQKIWRTSALRSGKQQ
mmetsp:Transcript_3552/g.7520  ORF Transcript_3552/g.7520 Transcript_3552/m.7520 type:complete len:112 (+) Transcript_3552:1-336(+)